MLHNLARFEQWLPALFDGQFHWDFLRPAFMPTAIMPSDIDALLERRGHFLVFESKANGKEIPGGQVITFTELWKKGFSIISLHGKTPESITGMAVYQGGKWVDGEKVGQKPMIACDAFDVLYYTRCWFCMASGDPRPTREEWDRQLWVWDYEREETEKSKTLKTL